MTLISKTPKTPYYAVIFTSILSKDQQGYEKAAQRMLQLAAEQDGFLGIESARDELGITVSYWRDLESISEWKKNTEHLAVQKAGKEKWYKEFTVRIARVEREYGQW